MKLPFTPPSPFGYYKRVLAHYFPSFPLSIDNQPAATDYYSKNYLVPGGESNKFLAQGGYLRARPLPVAPNTNTEYSVWGQANMELEVQMAIAVGITGFNMDILSVADTQAGGHFPMMAAAAHAVDPRFAVIPMFDMSTAYTDAQIVQMVESCVNVPNAYKISDGRFLFTAFNATQEPLTFWQSAIETLNDAGIDVAFMPILLGSPSTNPLAAFSYGYGQWGTAQPNVAQSCPPCAMMPILPQQFRPKDGIFWESSNFDTFRAGWDAAIAAGQQFVQIVTWNDFSESGQIQPCTDLSLATNIGTGYYALTAYYSSWYLTGLQPAITQDVLYWNYRKGSSSMAHANQTGGETVQNSQPELENIECLAFLTAPGMLSINGHLMQANSGITSFKVAATPGNPSMALMRNGSNVQQGVCPVTIYGPAGDPAGTLDLTYWSGNI
jgi:Glycosyl hydrolase family 71